MKIGELSLPVCIPQLHRGHYGNGIVESHLPAGKFPAFYLDKTWLCAYDT